MADEASDLVSFSLLAVLDTPRVNPGSRVRLEIYIYGTGVPSHNRLIVHVPTAIVEETVMVTAFSFAYGGNLANCRPVFPPDRTSQSNRFLIELNEHYFHSGSTGSHLWSESRMEPPEESRSAVERSYAPIEVEFAVPRKAPAGDHSISLKFVYSSASSSGVSETATKLCVSSFAERNRESISALLGLIVVLVPVFVSMAPARTQDPLWIASVLIALLLVWMLRS